MNSQTLIRLVVAAVVLSALAVFTSRDKTVPDGEADRAIWADAPMNEVAEVRIESPGGAITLTKADSGWVIREKFDYPIQFTQLRDFLQTLYELEVGQTISTSDAQRKEMQLLPPDSGKGAGSRVTLKKADGSTVLSFVAGKTFSSGSGTPGPMGMPAGSSGRFILVDDQAYLVYEPLTDVEDQIDDWYKTELVSGGASDLASLTVTGPERKQITLSRGADDTDFQLAGMPEDREPATSKINSLTGALGYLRFDDIADPGLSNEETGLNKPVTYTATRRNGQSITLSIGGETDEGRRYARISFAYTPPEKDPGDENTSATADPLQQETAKHQAFHEPWIYLLSDYKSDTMLTPFEDLHQEKKPEPESGAATPSADVPDIILGTE